MKNFFNTKQEADNFLSNVKNLQKYSVYSNEFVYTFTRPHSISDLLLNSIHYAPFVRERGDKKGWSVVELDPITSSNPPTSSMSDDEFTKLFIT